MKHTKKLFSLALAFIMAMALMVPAFAADITVTGAQAGETYTAYKVFDATQSGTNFAYTIQSDSKWYNVVSNYKVDADGKYNESGAAVFTLTPSASDAKTLIISINVKTVEEKKVSLFSTSEDAAEFAKYLATRIPSGAAKTEVTADKDGKAEFTGLDTGYYFIDTSLGSLCALYTYEGEQEIAEKNEAPSLEKKIVTSVEKEGQTVEEPVDSVSASINDTINYKITVTDGKGTDSAITVHDVMEAGLTLQGTGKSAFTVTTFDGTDADNTVAAIEDSDWSVQAGTETGEDATVCNFEIVFNADFIKKLDEGDMIVITYSAKLNENAEIASDTNDNTAWLTYSAQTSVKDTVSVITYKFDLVKTDKDSKLLDGAKFKLYDAQTAGNEVQLKKVEVKDAEDTVIEVYYRPIVDGETGEAIDVADGFVTVKGLASGTYYLEETVAPDGYNMLAEREKVELTTNLIASIDAANNTYESGGVRVINNTGVELPSTGGMGTTIFYVVGGVLMAGAAILLVTKKKMSDDQ